jgi:hypothetical protein
MLAVGGGERRAREHVPGHRARELDLGGPGEAELAIERVELEVIAMATDRPSAVYFIGISSPSRTAGDVMRMSRFTEATDLKALRSQLLTCSCRIAAAWIVASVKGQTP